jgi:hypothetical protein
MSNTLTDDAWAIIPNRVAPDITLFDIMVY